MFFSLDQMLQANAIQVQVSLSMWTWRECFGVECGSPLLQLRTVFQNATFWPEEDTPFAAESEFAPGLLSDGDVGVYLTDFEFVGPSACLVPSPVASTVPQPMMGADGKWLPGAILINDQMWLSLVEGHHIELLSNPRFVRRQVL